MAPQRTSFLVTHDHAVVPKQSGDGQRQAFVIHITGIHDAVVT
jgi:hypothetical protein